MDLTRSLDVARAYAAAVRGVVQERVAASSLDHEQHGAHGYAWIETLVAALDALHRWGARQSGEAEALIVAIGTGETLAQLAGGIAMGQNEVVRPGDFALEGMSRRCWPARRAATPPRTAPRSPRCCRRDTACRTRWTMTRSTACARNIAASPTNASCPTRSNGTSTMC